MLCFTFLLSVSTTRPPPISTLFPYTTLFRSALLPHGLRQQPVQAVALIGYEAVEGRRGVVAIAGHERSPVLLRCHRIGSGDRKSTRLNSSHVAISYAVFCLKKKKRTQVRTNHTTP